MTDLLTTLQSLIAIDSVTGHEGDYGDALARALSHRGYSIERQPLSPNRFNLLAQASPPRVLFCTHQDTVPPWFGPARNGSTITGRGACDAKGPALAMLAAADILLAEGEREIGFLFTVGEETDSAGADLASARRSEAWKPDYVIIGEPTENRFIRGGKGVVKGMLHAHGVAGHSSQPIGPSAVHELVHALHRLLSEPFGHHPVFGLGSINFGEIRGGVAANVVAEEAEASVLVRAVEAPAEVEARIRRHLGPHVEWRATKSYGPIEFCVPDGSEGPIVAFGTDAPFLRGFGEPVLYGPGSILDAHTSGEKITRESFERGIRDYTSTARRLLERSRARR